MLNSKQRAKLRSLANTMDTILQVGKGGVGETLIKQMDEALTARELVKARVLETSPAPAKEVANQLAQAVEADVVQVIGSKFVLYRPNPEEPVIDLGK